MMIVCLMNKYRLLTGQTDFSEIYIIYPWPPLQHQTVLCTK